jgi:hypothetical protein
MEQVKVLVSVPLAVALAAGRSQYGETLVGLDDAAVQSLSTGARALIGTDGKVRATPPSSYACALDVREATVADTCLALEARATDIEAYHAQQATEAEARILAALAAPDADWLGFGNNTERYYTIGSNDVDVSSSDSGRAHHRPAIEASPRGVYLSEEQRRDLRILAHRADLEARALPIATAAWEAKYAEWQAACSAAEAEREAEKARKLQVELNARRWAREYGRAKLGSAELVRAASEDRVVLPEIRRLAQLSVEHALEEAFGAESVVKVYAEEIRDGVPSAEAYALLDTLINARAMLTRAHGLPNLTSGPDESIAAGPIMRFDVAPKGTAVWRTGVRVTFTHPWLAEPIEWSVLAEPIDLDIDEDDDE